MNRGIRMKLKSNNLKSKVKFNRTSKTNYDKEHSIDKEFLEKWNAANPSDKHIIVVDEFGDSNLGKKSTERHFGFGISDVEHPRMYSGLSIVNKTFHFKDEKKANKSSQLDRILMSIGIRSTGSESSCVYVDKKGKRPHYMRDGSKTDEQILGLLEDSLKKTLPKKGIVWVIVDNNTQYRGQENVTDLGSKYSNKDRTVLCKQYKSNDNGLSSEFLQTNDYVANAARSKLKYKETLRSRILKMKYSKIEE